MPGTAHVLKGESIIATRIMIGKSQPDGGEGCSVMQRLSDNDGLKEAALLRQGNVNVRGDVQKSSQANLIGTRVQHNLKSSIHLLRIRCVYSAPTYRKTCVHPGRSHTGKGLNGGSSRMVEINEKRD